jgi:hypothetical protein
MAFAFISWNLREKGEERQGETLDMRKNADRSPTWDCAGS